MTQRAPLIKIGKFGRPQGVKGQVRIWTDNPDSETLCAGLKLHVGSEQFEIVEVKKQDRFFVATIAGFDDRNQAATLTNQEISVHRDDLPEPDTDEFYQIDLIGLPVEDAEGVVLGVVDGFLDDVDTDVLVVKRDSGILLVPMIGRIIHQLKPEHPVVIAPLEEWASEDE